MTGKQFSLGTQFPETLTAGTSIKNSTKTAAGDAPTIGTPAFLRCLMRFADSIEVAGSSSLN